jgi:hypothetical protein
MLNVGRHRTGWLWSLVVLTLPFMMAAPARAVPSGRAFKIGGYTQTGGEGPLAHMPLAAMVVGSFTTRTRLSRTLLRRTSAGTTMQPSTRSAYSLPGA